LAVSFLLTTPLPKKIMLKNNSFAPKLTPIMFAVQTLCRQIYFENSEKARAKAFSNNAVTESAVKPTLIAD
jgi:hypothetical protein